jgi:hypothetical protein
MKWQKYADAMRRYYDEYGVCPAFGETNRRRAGVWEEEVVSKEPPPPNAIQQARRNRWKPWK